jgi:hypothetical protein
MPWNSASPVRFDLSKLPMVVKRPEQTPEEEEVYEMIAGLEMLREWEEAEDREAEARGFVIDRGAPLAGASSVVGRPKPCPDCLSTIAWDLTLPGWRCTGCPRSERRAVPETGKTAAALEPAAAAPPPQTALDEIAPVTAPPASPAASSTPDLLRAWADALGEGDFNRAAAMFAPGATVTVLSGPVQSLPTFREALAWNAQFPFRLEPVVIYEGGPGMYDVVATINCYERGLPRRALGQLTALATARHGRFAMLYTNRR